MKVLFICSSKAGKPGILIQNQAISLTQLGHSVDYYLISGKGIIGYLKAIWLLKNYLIDKRYDVTHAHYSLSAAVASIAGAKPLIVSLMGSDVNSGYLNKLFVKTSRKIFRWKHIIVKSDEMYSNLRYKYASIIPNGVDINHFKPINKVECQRRLHWESGQKHVLFAADPKRPEKNFQLTEEGVKLINSFDINLHALGNIPHAEIPLYINASDTVILTSIWEGSPNVIKEAMACNCPVIATDVGDIKWLFDSVPGHYLVKPIPEDVSQKLVQSFEYRKVEGFTKGKERLIHLGLDSKNIAERIIQLYNSAIAIQK